MIVVKVELWPGGDASKAEPLGVIAIRNTGAIGTDSDLYGYEVELQSGKSHRRGRFTHWRRRGWLRCVRLALEAIDHT